MGMLRRIRLLRQRDAVDTSEDIEDESRLEK